MPLMNLPVRSIVAHIGESRALLISPGSQISKGQYDPQWGITDIIAPNLYHLDGVPKARAAYPSAVVWSPPGVQLKRPDLQWQRQLSETDWPYTQEMPLVFLEGAPKINEFLFINKATKSLLVADLCFNLIDSEGLGARLILSLFGTYKKFGVSRFYARSIADKEAFELSLGRLFSYEFDNIIPSHGHVLEKNAKDQLRAALAERGFKPRT